MAREERDVTDRVEPEVLSLAEAGERLASPYAEDEYSAACGRPWLAVELDGDAADEGVAAVLRKTLPQLACTSIALVSEGDAPAARELASCFDALAADRAQLDRLVAGVASAPLSATALVQLLRGQERRDVEQGIVAESFVYSMLQAGPEFAAWVAKQPTLRPEIPERPPLRITRDGESLDVLLDHPAKHNAYSAAMRDLLCEALELALSDDSIHGIVLRGAGSSFCSGGDLDEFGLLTDPATAHVIRTTRSAARLLAALAPKVRVELHGACIGAGIELPAFAGTVVAAEDTTIRLPEISMGLIPGAGGTVSLPRRIGRQRTAALALTGARLDANEARAWGLVDELG